MTEVTPKKIYPRKGTQNQSECRLCMKLSDNNYLIKILSKIGKSKGLCEKIKRTCGINIEETDFLPKVICRNCDKFIEKISNFHKTCQQTQFELRQNVSVKRMHLSPGIKTTKRHDASYETSEHREAQSKKRLPFGITPLKELNVNNTSNYHTQLPQNFVAIQPIGCDTNVQDENRIPTINYHKIGIALKTMQPAVIANAVLETPSIEAEVKKSLLQKLETSCKNICKRKGKISVLLDTSFTGIAEFKLEKLWKEMLEHPFLIDMLNAVSGMKEANYPDELRLKYCFLYSTLMNIRWHELSLFQRINTVLLIEGGCSKQVCTNLDLAVRHCLRRVNFMPNFQLNVPIL